MKKFEERVRNPEEHRVLFWVATGVWLVGLCCAILWGILHWQDAAEDKGFSIATGKVVAGIALIWLIFSIKTLRTDEIGTISCFGLPLIRAGRGPKVVIAGVFQLEKFTANVRQTQFPAEPELIQKTPDEVPLRLITVTLPDGSVTQKMAVRPIRITTRAPYTEKDGEKYNQYGGQILNVQMTVEFTFWVRWIIVDPFQFLISVGGDEEMAIQQIRDAGESYLNQQVVSRVPAELIGDFVALKEGISKAITDRIDPDTWGISILEVGLTAPDINHEVAEALRNIAKEQAIAKKKQIEADANAYVTERAGEAAARVTERTGKAEGAAKESVLVGEARGYQQSSELLGIPAEQILAATVARETVGEGSLILGADGIAQAIGIGKTILKKQGE